MNVGLAAVAVNRLSTIFSANLLQNPYLKQFVLFMSATGLLGLAVLLQELEVTSIAGSYAFAFSLIGLFRPAQMLTGFVFLISFLHKDFTYLSIKVGSMPLFITEWVLLILSLASIPRLRSLTKEYALPLYPILAFFGIGFLLLFFTLPYWGALAALRDFALVYYSFFTIMVVAHVRSVSDYKNLLAAMALGTVPNILVETANFLYNTPPYTFEQRNFSLRNSYYYLASLGICLPLAIAEKSSRRWAIISYCLGVYFLTLLYSYTTTAMIVLALITAIYLAPRFRTIPKKAIVAILSLFLLSLFLAPAGKVHSFKTVFMSSTYTENYRMYLDIAAIRDFTDHPYGIGFGAPIFGAHSHNMIENVDSFFSLHNSYLSILRRTGLAGAALFIFIIAVAYKRAISTLGLLPEASGKRKLLMGALLAMLSCTIFPLAHVALEGPFFASTFWILVGCLYSGARIFIKEPDESEKL